MPRRVMSTQLQAAGGNTVDTYFDKVVKYVPADVISAWTAASSLIATTAPGQRATLLWVAFACGVVITAAWTWRQTKVPGLAPALRQVAIATGAFAVWVYALGGPFALAPPFPYSPVHGSLALIGYTFLAGFVDQ